MSIDWISVKDRVPDNRRRVLAWGHATTFGLSSVNSKPGGVFMGATKFNRSSDGGQFDTEASGRFSMRVVSHWAEIEGPAELAVRPPAPPPPPRTRGWHAEDGPP